jgi:hypothetical protein
MQDYQFHQRLKKHFEKPLGYGGNYSNKLDGAPGDPSSSLKVDRTCALTDIAFQHALGVEISQ